MANDVTLDLGNDYIGSAYSPVVEITENEDGHTISITSADPDAAGHLVTQSFDVPNYSDEEAAREAAEAQRQAQEAQRLAAEDAREASESARAAAESSRASAEAAREIAENVRKGQEQGRAQAEQYRQQNETLRQQDERARQDAEAARYNAEQARAAAEMARDAAESERQLAEQAREDAEDARQAAEQARETASATAVANAEAATSAANTATQQAQAATTAANDAAAVATTAAGTANTAAAAADTAREGIQDDLDQMRSDIADKAFVDALSPLLTVGAALGITGDGPTETAAWLQRTSTSDGPTTIRSIHGNTIVQDGELLPVSMTGIETTGFNIFDEQWDNGDINSSTGQNTSGTSVRSKGYVPVISGQTYYFKCPTGDMYLWAYGADKGYIGRLGPSGLGSTSSVANATVTIPATVRFVRFRLTSAYGTTYNHDICINLSDPTRNGEYEPYWNQERTIDVASYFPDGMRSAGAVYDELTETQAITRIGERAYQSGDESDATVVTDGTVTHYPLATPTTTPIDPPLNLTYRTEQGGTERVIVPTGEQSAPPTIVTAQGYTAESLRDAALSTIAPVENGLASTNYAIGSYLVHGGQLCKVTTAIATGEAIVIGTNVTATTVMAEVLSLTQ